jgi:hypothetical protein
MDGQVEFKVWKIIAHILMMRDKAKWSDKLRESINSHVHPEDIQKVKWSGPLHRSIKNDHVRPDDVQAKGHLSRLQY